YLKIGGPRILKSGICGPALDIFVFDQFHTQRGSGSFQYSYPRLRAGRIAHLHDCGIAAECLRLRRNFQANDVFIKRDRLLQTADDVAEIPYADHGADGTILSEYRDSGD